MHAVDDVRPLVWRRIGNSLHRNRHGVAVVGERQIIPDRDTLDPGQALHFALQLVEKWRAMFLVRIFRFRQLNFHGQDVIGAETGIQVVADA